jgi:methylmalonyl-CoA mutase
MYQRLKFRKKVCIMKLKHSEFPIMGKYILKFKGSPTVIPGGNPCNGGRKIQIKTLENLQKANAKEVQQRLDAIQDAAIKNENLFDHLMECHQGVH